MKKVFFILYLFFIITVALSQSNSIIYQEGFNTITGEDTTGSYLNKNNKTINVSYTLKINEICANNGTTYLDEYGEYDDWIEIYNYGTEDVDLQGLYFSDDVNEPFKFLLDSSIIVSAGGFVVLWADEQPNQGRYHLNFKLSASGEHFSIQDISVGLIDLISFGTQNYDITYGCQPDGSTNLNYFTTATPNSSNTATGLLDIVPEPSISLNSGFYNSSQTITITESLSGCDIYYTADGTEPTTSSILYTSPISVVANTSIRAKAFKTDYIPSSIATKTYIFDEESSIPVLFVTSANSDIFQSFDIPVHSELIDEDGGQVFSIDAGSQLHGDNSAEQKSFKLFFRSMYGDNSVDEKLFEYKNVNHFKRLIFRAAGNDGTATASSDRAHMRDGIIATMANKAKLKFKAPGYKAVNVYLNGVYWGIFNMRERPDKYFIEDNYNYDADSPRHIFEYAFGYSGNLNVIEGDWNDFSETHHYCEDNDLAVQANYDYVDDRFDIEDFTDYWIYETYIGNFDWLSNNMTFWRPNISNGKYHWILWDTDHGIGLPYSNYGNPSWNTLEWATSTWSGRPWDGARTRIIRNLLDNEDYKYYFITRFSDLINKYFASGDFAEIVDSLEERIEDEIPKQIDKWGGSTVTSWEESFNTIRNYVDERPDYVRDHIKSQYTLEDLYTLQLDVTPANSGKFNLNTISLEGGFPWSGKYYEDMKITIEAIPMPGYQFVGWQNSSETSQEIEIYPHGNTTEVAIFEPISYEEYPVIFNEISYNQDNNFASGDWVEIYNRSDDAIDLTDWVFKDEDLSHTFTFPQNTILNENEYLVICSNQILFSSVYPNVDNYISEFDFGLSGGGELLRLYNSEGDIIDTVLYDDDAPWPEDADGHGPTLELIDVFYNNDFGENWQDSYIDGGTPGEQNSDIVSGIRSTVNYDEIVIYPNPTFDKVNIYLSDESDIVIYDLNGKNYVNEKLNKGQNIINLSFLKRGVYFIRVVNNSNITVKKIVKL